MTLDKDVPISSLNYFRETNLISDSTHPSFNCRLFKEFVQAKALEEKSLQFVDGQLMIAGVNVTGTFSHQDIALLTKLITNKNRVIERNKLGAEIWGSQEYSDWSLDQAISRLRKRLITMGLPGNLIKSIRGKGLCYQES